VLLELFDSLATNGERVRIVVEGMGFQKDGEPLIVGENDEYFYDEATCPSNYLGVPIFVGEDGDPHGVFSHVETVVKPSPDFDSKILSFEELRELFPSLKKEPSNG